MSRLSSASIPVLLRGRARVIKNGQGSSYRVTLTPSNQRAIHLPFTATDVAPVGLIHALVQAVGIVCATHEVCQDPQHRPCDRCVALAALPDWLRYQATVLPLRPDRTAP